MSRDFVNTLSARDALLFRRVVLMSYEFRQSMLQAVQLLGPGDDQRIHEMTIEVITEKIAPALLSTEDMIDAVVPAVLRLESADKLLREYAAQRRT